MVILSSAGARIDIELRRGAAFARTFTHKTNGTPTNISSYTFNGQIRTQNGTLAATFTVAIVNAAAGTFSIALTSATTSALVPGTTYSWDLEQVESGTTTELLRGFVTVIDEVTV